MDWLSELRNALAREFADRPIIGVLATVSPEQTAAGRCVVLRELTDSGGLVFTTDARSEKVEHLSANPSAECVFWLPTLRLQFRIGGEAAIDTASRSVLWAKLSPATQATFFGPPPGVRKGSASPDTKPSLADPPACFSVLVLTPDRAESLDLTTDPHTRVEFSEKAGWQPVAINP